MRRCWCCGTKVVTPDAELQLYTQTTQQILVKTQGDSDSPPWGTTLGCFICISSALVASAVAQCLHGRIVIELLNSAQHKLGENSPSNPTSSFTIPGNSTIPGGLTETGLMEEDWGRVLGERLSWVLAQLHSHSDDNVLGFSSLETLEPAAETPTQPAKMSMWHTCALVQWRNSTYRQKSCCWLGAGGRMRAGAFTSRDQRETICDLYFNVAFTHINKTSQLPLPRWSKQNKFPLI